MFRLTLGLKPPPNERPGDLVGFDEMRKRIREGARDSALIHAAMCHADYSGLNGEDRYVLLAYSALVELERQHQALMRFVETTPLAGRVVFQKEPKP